MSTCKVHPKQDTIVELQDARDIPRVQLESSVKERDPDRELIHKVLLPLTISMRILGLYFEKTEKLRATKQYSRFYCLSVVVIMWLNAVRMFTIFSGDDNWQGLFQQIGTIVWTVMGAVTQTSCYRASQKGRIQEVLLTFNEDTSSRWAKRLRIKVTVCVVFAWISVTFSIASTAYFSFGEYASNNVLIAPYNTLILHANRLAITAMSTAYLVMHFYTSSAAIFPLLWNYALSSVISHEFKKCTKMVCDIVQDPEAAMGNFETIRSRHQALCRMVDKVDGQICVNTTVYLVGNIFLTVLYLYTLMFNAYSRINEYFLSVLIIWIISPMIGLIIVAHSGIMINQSVHKIFERIQDIDLTNLSAETIGQINAFLIRLSGEPIGITVLKLFVIDRNTILTILGLLITYFLLTYQLFPPSTDNPSYPASSANKTLNTGVINNTTANFF